jgi:hypothetical protein
MRQFVPMTDELLYETGGLSGPLVPYRCGVPCWHALQPEHVARSDTNARRGDEPAVNASRSADRPASRQGATPSRR